MKIVCWNVNGLKTVRAYRPWYNLRDWQACLDHLEADVGCFQEVKATRTNALSMDRDMCKPHGYAAFFNLHPTKGYSGTVTYVSEALGTPLAAEAGITGALVDKSNNKNDPTIGHFPDPRDEPVWDTLDVEGRAVVVDFGMFVLFNLYCPNETDETRREYKMAYNEALQERAYRLLDAGREVIIVGDLNIAHLPIDHCDAVGKVPNAKFLEAHPARAWLDTLLAPNGRFHDVTRERHSTRQGMYTCWNTLIDARPSNYGTRIDFTLVSKGLLPWIKDADISPDVYGSDHCPIWIELHEEIVDENGQPLKLRELINNGCQKGKLPSLASASWPEFSQRNLKSFFSTSSKPARPNGTAASKLETKLCESESSSATTEQLFVSPSSVSASASTVNPLSTKFSGLAAQQPSLSDAFAALDGEAATQTTTPHSLSETTGTASTAGASSSAANSAPSVASASSMTTKAKVDKSKKKKGQLKLKAFFTPPPNATSTSAASGSAQTSSSAAAMGNGSSSSSSTSAHLGPPSPPTFFPGRTSAQDEFAFPFETDASPDATPTASADPAERVSASLAWGSIFRPPPAPRCNVHNEPARAWTVNKPGVNHGRKFYMCARPVGPGYEKEGRAKIDIDKQYRCGYWKWASDLGSNSKRSAAAASLDEQPKSLGEVAYTAPALGSGDRRGTSAPKEGGASPHKRVKTAER